MEISGQGHYREQTDFSFGSKAYRAYYLGRKGSRRISDKAKRIRAKSTARAERAELDRRSEEARADHLALLAATAKPTRKARTRLSAEDKAAIAQESLVRARCGMSVANWGTIFEEFISRGIPESDIIPRVNVLTFNAWKALGRCVCKGEHGVKIAVWIDPRSGQESLEDGEESKRRGMICRSAYVFHVSQTREWKG